MADGVAASSFSELQEPEAIIVAPTRELINQIYLEARKFAYGYVLNWDIDTESFNPLGCQIHFIQMPCMKLHASPGLWSSSL